MPRHTAVLVYSMFKTPLKEGETDRGKRGSFCTFHSAEGRRRHDEPQRSPKLHYLKNAYCTFRSAVFGSASFFPLREEDFFLSE